MPGKQDCASDLFRLPSLSPPSFPGSGPNSSPLFLPAELFTVWETSHRTLQPSLVVSSPGFCLSLVHCLARQKTIECLLFSFYFTLSLNMKVYPEIPASLSLGSSSFHSSYLFHNASSCLAFQSFFHVSRLSSFRFLMLLGLLL